jgi:hypothetical protein
LRLATGRWFSPGTSVSSTNKTDCHDIAEILLNVALNTIKETNKHQNLLKQEQPTVEKKSRQDEQSVR